MRFGATLAGILLAASAAAAQGDPATTVQRAIEAHGGAEPLTKYKAGQYSLAGKMSLPQVGEVDYTSEVTYEAPDKYALTLVLNMNPQKVTLGQVVNGDKTRITVDGRAQAVSAAMKGEAKAAAAMQEITQLTPLLDPARYALKAQPETTFRGQPAAAVVVAPANGKEITLFFAAKDGLLLGTRRQGLDPQEKAVSEETFLSDYAKVQGVSVPMSVEVTHDGKKFTTMKQSNVKLMESADPKLFKAE